MTTAKPRVIKDFEKLDPLVQERIRNNFPLGFDEHLVSFTNRDGNKVSALPFEDIDFYYLVRMTISEAQEIFEEAEEEDDQEASLGNEEVNGSSIEETSGQE